MDPVPDAVLKTAKKFKPVTNRKKIGVGSWNIRRGLIIREQELKDIVKSNALNIIFLTETDTNAVNTDKDFKIPGFKTIVQLKKNESLPTRIIGLIDESMASRVIIRNDLASTEFPSLWVEIENSSGKNVICGGFYREWAPGGDASIPAQIEAMQIFTGQIERATTEKKVIVITGDANLCSEKWDSPNYKQKSIADELRETLAQCGIINVPLGTTYTADRLNDDGSEIRSALDHVYTSQSFLQALVTKNYSVRQLTTSQ